MALQLTPIVQKPVLVHYELQFDYTCQNDVMTILKQYNCSITRHEQQLFCIMDVGIPKARVEEVTYRLNDLRSVDVKKLQAFPVKR